jgi:hypothetical protein
MSGDKQSALAVRLKLEQQHPEISISSPLTSLSGMWELTIEGNDATSYADFWMMIDYISERYQVVETVTAPEQS